MRPVALITGGTRGIGLGIAQSLAQEGCDLALAGVRDESAVSGVLDRLRALGADVLYCSADIGETSDRAHLVQQVRQRYKRLHYLVNNAGVAPRERKDICDVEEESYERVMRVNLQGPFFLTQAVANWMIEQKQSGPEWSGCIVNVSSISATVASPSRGEYCISKAGLGMATQLWAVRLGEHGIPVYEVRPGITQTDMTAGVQEKYDQLIQDGLLVQSRWGQPEDVGKAVALLCRGDLPYSTGQVLMVDGGLTLPRL